MFPLRCARPLQVQCSTRHLLLKSRPLIVSRRSFSSNPITLFGDGILGVGDALSALPFPEFIGPYAAGIILSTLAIRTAVTLPVFFWARRRVMRHRDIVIPKIIEWRKPFAKDLAIKAKAQPNPKEWFESEFKTAAIDYRNKLLKEHKCRPWVTSLMTPLTLIPTIVTTSLAIRAVCIIPNSPLLHERFLSDVPLALPDATGVFPITVGLLALSSLELSRRFAKERARELKETAWVKDHVKTQPSPAAPVRPKPKQTMPKLVKTDKGWEIHQTTSKPPPVQRDSALDKVAASDDGADPSDARVNRLSGIFEQVARGGAILMIGISMWSPGALTLCWVTSSSFSIMQQLLGRWWEQRHPYKAPDPQEHTTE